MKRSRDSTKEDTNRENPLAQRAHALNNHEKASETTMGNLYPDSSVNIPKKDKSGLCLVCDFSPQSLIGGIEKTINETLPRLSKNYKINIVTTGITGESLSGSDVKLHLVRRKFGANILSRLVTYVMFFLKTLEIHRKDPFQIIHAHSNMSGFPAFVASRFLNSKFVLTVHFSWPFCLKGTSLIGSTPCKFRYNTNLIRNIAYCTKSCSKRTNPIRVLWGLISYVISQIMMRKADAIIVLTPEARNRLLKIGIQRDRIYLVSNPIFTKKVKDGEAKQFRKELGLNNDDKMILFIGRVVYEKGLDVLINTLANLQDSVHLVVIGTRDKNYFKDLQKLIEKLKLQDRVHFTGFLPVHSLYSAYKSCDLFVHPSRWYEMTGTTLLEAFSFRKPVIASGLGGPNWFVGNQRGIYIEPNNVAQLTNAIKLCLSDAEYAAKISDNGFNFAKDFTEERYLSKIMDVYSKTVGKH